MELLVVISITALMASILLPSMGRAREQAKIIACQSNLRQIVVGVLDYASAYGDRAPLAAPQELGGPTGRVRLDDPWLPARMFGGGLAANKRPLNRRLDNMHAVFRCPSDKGEPLWWFDTEPYQASATAYELYGSSYFYMSGYNRMNGVVSPMGLAKFVGLDFAYGPSQASPLANGRPRTLTFFPQPSKKVLIADIPIHRALPGVVAPNPRAQWHRKDPDHLWANAGFVDGHTEFVRVFPYDAPPHHGAQSIPSPRNPYF